MLVFEWWQYDFMRNAFWALLIISPLFALVGSLVVNARMSFFSDAIGHSALTGLAIGTLLGMNQPSLMVVFYSLLLSLIITALKYKLPQKTDTFIALIMSFSVALGLVLLTRGGQFSKFSNMLIGDLLSIGPQDLIQLGILFGASLIFLSYFLRQILLVSLNASLARSRGINVFLVEFLFAAFVSVVVSLSIPWVGLLVVNSLLVLPAASANNLSRGIKSYLLTAIVFSVLASLIGLSLSYTLSSATGATIVLILMFFFVLSFIFKKDKK